MRTNHAKMVELIAAIAGVLNNELRTRRASAIHGVVRAEAIMSRITPPVPLARCSLCVGAVLGRQTIGMRRACCGASGFSTLQGINKKQQGFN